MVVEDNLQMMEDEHDEWSSSYSVSLDLPCGAGQISNKEVWSYACRLTSFPLSIHRFIDSATLPSTKDIRSPLCDPPQLPQKNVVAYLNTFLFWNLSYNYILTWCYFEHQFFSILLLISLIPFLLKPHSNIYLLHKITHLQSMFDLYSDSKHPRKNYKCNI